LGDTVFRVNTDVVTIEVDVAASEPSNVLHLAERREEITERRFLAQRRREHSVEGEVAVNVHGNVEGFIPEERRHLRRLHTPQLTPRGTISTREGDVSIVATMHEVDHRQVGGDGNAEGVGWGLERLFVHCGGKSDADTTRRSKRRWRRRRRVDITSDTERRLLRGDELEELCFVHGVTPS
jgi:hypothetical protein